MIAFDGIILWFCWKSDQGCILVSRFHFPYNFCLDRYEFYLRSSVKESLWSAQQEWKVISVLFNYGCCFINSRRKIFTCVYSKLEHFVLWNISPRQHKWRFRVVRFIILWNIVALGYLAERNHQGVSWCVNNYRPAKSSNGCFAWNVVNRFEPMWAIQADQFRSPRYICADIAG